MEGSRGRCGLSNNNSRNEGKLVPLTAGEADSVQHELAEDPSAQFFRVVGPVRGERQQPPLREGDTLIVLSGALPNDGDPIVVQLEGNGYLLGRSRREGTWCLLVSGAAVPLGNSGSSVRVIGVVVGVLRKMPDPVG
jgi:SOS-response transcriptional repressor LexA